MMDEEHKVNEEDIFFIRVPDNEKANYEYLSVNMPHVKSYSFTEDEAWFLMTLFDRFNKKFGILIDLYEDDYIKPEHLSEAIEMTKAFAAENAGCPFDDAIKRFTEAAELALANQVWLIFDF
ncbi:MAG: hypothetical protein IJS08_01665 [Victivallales bacterium]|nr:hypothetical protein [Victivallales bacterium]